MAAWAVPEPAPVPRKPHGTAQYNWITGTFDRSPEQMELEFSRDPGPRTEPDDAVQLLATENGAQLVVSGFGLSLGKKSERVAIKLKGKACGEIPLFRLQEIVLVGRGISISTDLIEALCERGIRLGILSVSGKPVALLTSPYLTATVATRRAQLEATGLALGADFIRWIVAGKLHNQEKLLRYFGKSRSGEAAAGLQAAADALRGLRRQALDLPGSVPETLRPHAMGLEGAGARAYWGSLVRLVRPELGFTARVHNQPEDAVNAALNYGYGILYSHVWGAVMNAGLEPFAGFLHGDRPGKPSLVLDLVEEFRQPVVDRPLFAWLLKGGELDLEGGLLDGPSRENVAARVLARLNAEERHRGKSHQVRSIIQMQARLAASAVRGLKPYRPFAFQW